MSLMEEKIITPKMRQNAANFNIIFTPLTFHDMKRVLELSLVLAIINLPQDFVTEQSEKENSKEIKLKSNRAR